ncbi:MAG: hypothetical protein IPH31_10365 [Lewinellaceae bacterium]|nr:hypothetical protein [Lewinellaceae bacterium]
MKPIVLFLPLLLAVSGIAQKRMQIPSGCAFDTDVKNLDPYTFDADPQAQQIVAEICAAIGIQQNSNFNPPTLKTPSHVSATGSGTYCTTLTS